MDDAIKQLPTDIRTAARLVYGHMPYGVHSYFAQPCEYATVMRHPVDRSLASLHAFIHKDPRHVLHEQVVREGVTLETYVESAIDEGQTENSQTRQLAGSQAGPDDAKTLEAAKGNLDGFMVVGLTDRFEESFVLLRRAVHLKMPFYAKRNATSAPRISDRARALILERNLSDLELYGYAQEMFKARIQQQGRSFGLEVTALKALRPLSSAAGGRTGAFVERSTPKDQTPRGSPTMRR